jgi:Lon protease-like protein
MSHKLEELPLFPLNTVLFPYAALQLHVFEERYRDMVRECIEFERPFGIVLIRRGAEVGGDVEPYMVGTAVRIVQVHHYEDGRMDLHVQGERRFRIRELDESRSFLIGKVEPVIELEIEETPRSRELLYRAREEFENLIHKLFARQELSVKVQFPNDPVVLSFTIANLLPMENLEKQRLLETTDTLERVEELIPILQNQNLDAVTPNFYRVNSKDLDEWNTPN